MRRVGEPPKKEGRTKYASDKVRKRYIAHYKTLPDQADPAVELNWIKVHPKMIEVSVNDEVPILVLADIKTAPSKAAVVALQHWVNHPKDFHKNMINDAKKAIATKDPEELGDGAEYPEITDILELLQTLEGAVRPGEDLVITPGSMQEEYDA